MNKRPWTTTAILVTLATVLALASPAAATRKKFSKADGAQWTPQERVQFSLARQSLRNGAHRLHQAKRSLKKNLELLDSFNEKGGSTVFLGEKAPNADGKALKSLPLPEVAKKMLELAKSTGITQRYTAKGLYGGSHTLVAREGMTPEEVTATYAVICDRQTVKLEAQRFQRTRELVGQLLSFAGELQVSAPRALTKNQLQKASAGELLGDLLLVAPQPSNTLPAGQVLFDASGVARVWAQNSRGPTSITLFDTETRAKTVVAENAASPRKRTLGFLPAQLEGGSDEQILAGLSKTFSNARKRPAQRLIRDSDAR